MSCVALVTRTTVASTVVLEVLKLSGRHRRAPKKQNQSLQSFSRQT